MDAEQNTSSPDQLRVFLSSPGELEAHRQVVRQVCTELSIQNARTAPFTFHLAEWPRTIAASAAPYLQSAINQQVADYDVLLCLINHRMGTPTPRASSGTEEEFDRAYELHLQTGRPQLLIYFSNIPNAPSEIDPAQLAQVRVFSQKLSRLGVLAQSYADLNELRELVYTGLTYASEASRRYSSPHSPIPASTTPSESTQTFPSIRLQSRLFNPQWADYLTIPLSQYRGKDFSVRWRMTTDWAYFRQGFKLAESKEPVLSAGGVQTSGTNLLIHLGRNSKDQPWFVSPYKHGLRITEDRPLADTNGKTFANCEVRVNASGKVTLAVDGTDIHTDFLVIDGYPQMYLLAWGDEHRFSCDISDIEVIG